MGAGLTGDGLVGLHRTNPTKQPELCTSAAAVRSTAALVRLMRSAALLQVMSAVEQKIPGHYTRGMDCSIPNLHDVDAAGCTDEWGAPMR